MASHSESSKKQRSRNGLRRQYRVGSLFAGMGGFCLAFQQEGFDVLRFASGPEPFRHCTKRET